jgi:hypothetical protein
MVKGISRRVILVQSPDTKLFEQAIFILKDGAREVTDELLLQEAKGILNSTKKRRRFSGPVWACAGALGTGVAWLLTILL